MPHLLLMATCGREYHTVYIQHHRPTRNRSAMGKDYSQCCQALQHSSTQRTEYTASIRYALAMPELKYITGAQDTTTSTWSTITCRCMQNKGGSGCFRNVPAVENKQAGFNNRSVQTADTPAPSCTSRTQRASCRACSVPACKGTAHGHYHKTE